MNDQCNHDYARSAAVGGSQRPCCCLYFLLLVLLLLLQEEGVLPVHLSACLFKSPYPHPHPIIIMRKISFSSLVPFFLLVLVDLVPLAGGSEPARAVRSGFAAEEVAARELKGKKNKSNKSPKAPKSKMPKSNQISPSSQPTNDPACATQKDVLLAFKEGIIGNDSSKLTNWISTTDPCDDAWEAIVCVGGEVTQINLGTLCIVVSMSLLFYVLLVYLIAFFSCFGFLCMP